MSWESDFDGTADTVNENHKVDQHHAMNKQGMDEV
jgi:hypothetical protein